MSIPGDDTAKTGKCLRAGGEGTAEINFQVRYAIFNEICPQTTGSEPVLAKNESKNYKT
jgi:hypothetical protein